MKSAPLKDHKMTPTPEMTEKESLSRQISELMNDQRFGVLSSCPKDGWPYGNLISFAVTDNLLGILFVTPRNTKKFANISDNEKISMLITNERNDSADIDHAVSVTVMGIAQEVTGSERESSIATLVGKHPRLESFFRSPMNALVRIDVVRYIFVSRFETIQVLELGQSSKLESRTR